MFESIELLVDYYMKNADGLPGKLTRPIEPIDEAQRALKKQVIAHNQAVSQGQIPHHPNGADFNQNRMNGSTILPPMHGNGLHLPHTDIPSRRAQPSPPQPSPSVYDPNEFKGAEAPHIPYEQLETTEQLGEGEFGSVLRKVDTNYSNS